MGADHPGARAAGARMEREVSPAPQTVDPFDVLSLAQQGMTAKEAADILDCHLSTVYTHAADMGVTFHNPTRADDQTRALTRQLRDQGWTYSQIAKRTGMSVSWVAMFLKGKR